MANSGDLYSRKLSTDARAKLVAFFAAYIVTGNSEHPDMAADIAKGLAIDLLQTTDIDILVFATCLSIFHSKQGIILTSEVLMQRKDLVEAAEALVAICEKAFEMDKRARSGSREN